MAATVQTNASLVQFEKIFRRILLCGFWIVSPFAFDLSARAASVGNSIEYLHVERRSTDGRDALLSMHYTYDGANGPIATILPVLIKNGSEDLTHRFRSSGTTVTQGQGVVTVQLKFLGTESSAKETVTSDRIVVRMLNSSNRIILATASFLEPFIWGQVTPAPETMSREASNKTSDELKPKLDSEKKKTSSTESHSIESKPKPAASAWTSKLRTAFGTFSSHSSGSNTVQKLSASAKPDSRSARNRPGSLGKPPTPGVQRPALTERPVETHTLPAKAEPSAPRQNEIDAKTTVATAVTSATLQTVLAAAASNSGAVTQNEAGQPASQVLSSNLQGLAAGISPGNASNKNSNWQEHLTLGPGDVLNFSLFGEPETTKTDVFVGPDGRVSFLEAQNFLASGLTVDELRTKMDEELAKFRRAPRTMVSPVAFHSKKYLMLGAIAKGGVFTMDQPLTVIEAVARAGGIQTGLSGVSVTDMADLSRSFLVRHGQRYPVNFEKLFEEGDLSQNVTIEPDDYLYFVANDHREIFVLGAVAFPGSVSYLPNLTAIGAIAAGGGFTDRAWQRRILVIRGSLNKPETFVVNASDILSSKAQDFKLQPKDILYVSQRPWIRAEELLDAAATSFVESAVIMWTGIHLTR